MNKEKLENMFNSFFSELYSFISNERKIVSAYNDFKNSTNITEFANGMERAISDIQSQIEYLHEKSNRIISNIDNEKKEK